MTIFLFAFGFLLLLLPRANAVATNDNFNQRATLFGDRLTVTASSIGATRAPNEPAMAGVDSGASLWWVWRPTVEGRAVLDTTGSSFDTVLGVYFGKEIGQLDNRWGANDNDGANLTSRIEFNADPSVDHSIVVAGKNSASGDVVLNIRLYTLPVIVESPKDLEVTSGQSADFRVRALGKLNLSYQWQFKGADIVGETGELLRIQAASLLQAGPYRVIVSNSYGSVTSAPTAFLKVVEKPKIIENPADASKEDGDDVSFGVKALGEAPLSYQWRSKPTADAPYLSIAGANAPLLSLTNLSGIENGNFYSVRVFNPFGEAFSLDAKLTVLTSRPRITDQSLA